MDTNIPDVGSAEWRGQKERLFNSLSELYIKIPAAGLEIKNNYLVGAFLGCSLDGVPCQYLVTGVAPDGDDIKIMVKFLGWCDG